MFLLPHLISTCGPFSFALLQYIQSGTIYKVLGRLSSSYIVQGSKQVALLFSNSLNVVGNPRASPSVWIVVLVIVPQRAPLSETRDRRIGAANLHILRSAPRKSKDAEVKKRTTTWWCPSKKSVEYPG